MIKEERDGVKIVLLCFASLSLRQNCGSSPILGFLVIYKRLLKTGREKSHTAESYPM
jgi:hypothetical protein